MHELVVATSLVAFLPHVQKLEMPTKTTTHKLVFHQSLALYYINDEEHEVGWCGIVISLTFCEANLVP
jgi:hypothetical protein